MPSNLKLDSNRPFFSPCDLEIWWMTSKNNRALLLYKVKLCASFQFHQWIQTGVTVRKPSIRVKIGEFGPAWLWNLTNDLEKIKGTSSILHLVCASFKSHGWIQTGVSIRKRSIRVKMGNFLSRVSLKFNRWPWKSKGHLSYAAWSYVHHFIAIGKFKLDLQSENAQFGSKSAIFGPVWPWNLTDDLENQ